MTMWTDLAGLPYRQAFYDAKGIRTRVIEAGEGEPLICLHGTGGHAEAYLRNFGAHAKHFRIISVDMIGHGYSDAPDMEYSMQTLVDHLGDLIDVLGLKKVSLSGVSLGGMVAAWYAIQHPERVNRLAMVTAHLMSRDQAGKRDLADVLARSRKAAGTPSREAVRTRLAWLMHEPEKSVTEELVDVRYGIYAQPGRGEIITRISNLIIGGLLEPEWTARWSEAEHLRKLRCPTLMLWTRFNPGLTAERAAVGMKCISDARMIVYEKSAHWPQWEEPERFNKDHVEFMLGRT